VTYSTRHRGTGRWFRIALAFARAIGDDRDDPVGGHEAVSASTDDHLNRRNPDDDDKSLDPYGSRRTPVEPTGVI
jgi:hypothetical protein